MLLNFKVSNYKSFVDEIEFKMTPAPKIHDLDYSVINNKVGKKSIKSLSSAVIYGPNASGKTNLIGAIEVLKSIVIRGHVRNMEGDSGHPNIAKSQLELIPNINSDKNTPVNFSIEFIKNGLLIEYHLGIILGDFLDTKAERSIQSEELYVNGKMIFSRKEILEIGDIKSISGILVKEFDEKASAALSKNNLNDQELYLISLFKAVYSNVLVNSIIEWFEKNIVIIYSADKLRIRPDLGENTESGNFYINTQLNKAMKELDLLEI